MFAKDAHCSYCGHAFTPAQPWPRTCGHCRHISYRNPLPVAVVLVPVDRGLLVVRRGIEPGLGKLALPGGYVDFAESWQQAGAREVFEETGLHLEPREIQDFRARSSPTREGILVIFGVAGKRRGRDLPPFAPTDETTERLILTEPAELAFTLHTEAVADFFARRRRRRTTTT
jgi:ADP-ribose pyrophosphatase YjhB (NUDIX family)